jgi:type II secretory pathway component PulM
MLLLAEAPALPLDEAGKYVAGAFVVFVVLILIYVAIMAAKLARIERELTELASFAEQRAGHDEEVRELRPDGDRGAPGCEAEAAEEAARI